MKKTRMMVFLLVLTLLMGMSSLAAASGNVKFNAAKVYFQDNGDLAVEGYFVNSGAEDVSVQEMTLNVFLVRKGQKQLLANASFSDVNATVPSGGSAHWVFTMAGVPQKEIGQWFVQSRISW